MTGDTPSISEEMLVAYADGELDEVNRRRIVRALAQDKMLVARLAAHRRLAASLNAEFGPLAQEMVPERFRTLLHEGSQIVPISPSSANPRIQRWIPFALAASLALGLLVGRGIEGYDAPVSMQGGQMIAQGGLAKILDTQLASTQSADAATRIGLTFRSKAGSWCRSFTGAALSGVACRSGDEWRLEQALPGDQKQTAYRQASSGNPHILATVGELMVDVPANAASELRARDRGWK